MRPINLEVHVIEVIPEYPEAPPYVFRGVEIKKLYKALTTEYTYGEWVELLLNSFEAMCRINQCDTSRYLHLHPTKGTLVAENIAIVKMQNGVVPRPVQLFCKLLRLPSEEEQKQYMPIEDIVAQMNDATIH